MKKRFPSALALWSVIALYVLGMGLLIQLVLLPFVFTSLHAGNGLLIGGDWLLFHRVADRLACRIEWQGWSQWELRPEGQGPSGILAILYVLTVHKPFVYLPLNAILHASAAIVLLKIGRFFVPADRFPLPALAPFVFFPSSMLWLSQVHKDGFFILGNYLFLFAWLLMSAAVGGRRSFRESTAGILASSTGGIALVWMMRPAGVEMLLPVSLVLGVLVIGQAIYRWKKRALSVRRIFAVSAMVGLILGAEYFFVHPMSHYSPTKEPSSKAKILWSNVLHLPDFADRRFCALARQRDYYRMIYPDSTSRLDIDRGFHNALQIIFYFPRALEIGTLAPFPNSWFSGDKHDSGKGFWMECIVETIVVYLSLIALVYGIVKFYFKRMELWICLILVSMMMWISAIVIPNLGTLYRLRYGHEMILVMLGLCSIGELLRTRRRPITGEKEAAIENSREAGARI